MAEIITRTFEMSLGHRFRLYAEWMAGRARREAEAARAAAAAVVAAKGRRAQASATVSERARPAAAPSLFRPLRPGDHIVTLTTTMPPSTTPTTAPLTQGPAAPRMEPEPVGAIFDRRQTAVARMATWHRGDPGARRASADPVIPAPAAHATQPTTPLPVAEIFASRQRTIAAARPLAARKES